MELTVSRKDYQQHLGAKTKRNYWRENYNVINDELTKSDWTKSLGKDIVKQQWVGLCDLLYTGTDGETRAVDQIYQTKERI
jgi:hypothetical protein